MLSDEELINLYRPHTERTNPTHLMGLRAVANAAAKNALEEAATAIIHGLTDPDPCEYDHNHSCQAHGDFYIPAGEMCATQRAKDFLASIPTTTKENE